MVDVWKESWIAESEQIGADADDGACSVSLEVSNADESLHRAFTISLVQLLLLDMK